jgi:hypothetical protein
MNLKSNDIIFNAYNGRYIDMTVNGTVKKFYVTRAPLNTDFDEYALLNPITDTYNVISESTEQTCE